MMKVWMHAARLLMATLCQALVTGGAWAQTSDALGNPSSRFMLPMPAASDPAPTTDASRFQAWQQQGRAVYRAALLWPALPTVQATLIRSEPMPLATPAAAPAPSAATALNATPAASTSGYGETPLRPQPQASQIYSYVREQYQLQLTEHSQTEAYLLRPTQVRAGVLLLHDHGAFFAIGKEKWLAAPTALASNTVSTAKNEQLPAATASPWSAAQRWQAKYFEGHAIADDLAAQGYMVLVADSVGFASHGQQHYADQQQLAAHLLATGHSLAGLAAVEDLQLAAFLRSQLGADKPLVSLGFSMGAFRAWQVAALSDEVDASAAVCWFGRWQDMVLAGSNLDKGQTAFYFLHPGLNARYDIPDLVSMAAPKPLYLINGGQDMLMPVDGVQQGYRQLQQVWRLLGAEAQLRTELWSEAGHRFTAAQQQQVWQWLQQVSGTPRSGTPTSGTFRSGTPTAQTPDANTPASRPR